MEYQPNRQCPCEPGDDFPECATHGIVARGGTREDQLRAIDKRDGVTHIITGRDK
jgi:hypothetical protein